MFSLIELIKTNDEYHLIAYLIVLLLLIICCIFKSVRSIYKSNVIHARSVGNKGVYWVKSIDLGLKPHKSFEIIILYS